MTLGTLFSRLGFTRDDATWGRLQALSLAALVASGTIDLQYWAGYLGIHLGVIAQHWIITIAAVTLWISGKNDTSDLPGKSGPAAGSVDLRKIAPVILLAAALGAGALASTSCAQNQNPNLSPAGKRAANADAVLKRIGELQAAVIDAADSHAIPQDVANKIVFFTVEGAKITGSAKDGWLNATYKAWSDLKPQIPASYRQQAAVGAAWVALEVLFAEYGVGPGAPPVEDARAAR